uniref:ATP synthase complex subunit 8 n=2 Tax=Acoptolabrus TaxID=49287 RepID=A0A6C0NA62_9CARA|nr:ATP synthase F0 subunit 8 [Carabus mirabilissimus mirabilissimus]YP_009737802.1 ATP synthase F0 subunit 8 [Carabus changeonleei]ACT36234.1 ATP synthase F0 subunit 8 [Carabus mirabilissimus mirabilissimus]QHW07537.1 ATP synthase F0 subunit 8 [Carabus changeonleei]WNS64151.1 ATP synthase F0 subunit 8 [Carabus leechi yooni]
MPQMAPMNWLFLYFLFTIIFLMFNFLNYYLYLVKNTSNYKSQYNFNKKILNWKW